jgi:hypothetical protein
MVPSGQSGAVWRVTFLSRTKPICKSQVLRAETSAPASNHGILVLIKPPLTVYNGATGYQTARQRSPNYEFGPMAPGFELLKNGVMSCNNIRISALFAAVFRCTAASRHPKQAHVETAA